MQIINRIYHNYLVEYRRQISTRGILRQMRNIEQQVEKFLFHWISLTILKNGYLFSKAFYATLFWYFLEIKI